MILDTITEEVVEEPTTVTSEELAVKLDEAIAWTKTINAKLDKLLTEKSGKTTEKSENVLSQLNSLVVKARQCSWKRENNYLFIW